VNGIQTEGFLYKDQLNPYAWMDGSGNEKAIFIYGEMTHVPSYMIKSGIKYKYVTDHLGSVRALVNMSTGTLAQSITYDEFGNQLSNTNPDFQPFGYVGGITDYDTDLIRFGARDYDPSIGRWTSKEPLGFGGGSNWYIYSENDPINIYDVTGELCTYSQSSGDMSCTDDATGELYYTETGYSGTNDTKSSLKDNPHHDDYINQMTLIEPIQGLNSPDAQDYEDIGPLPQGDWEVGETYDDPNLGKNVMRLHPRQNNTCVRKCDTFRMHGDNKKRNNSASSGCLILPPNRTEIPKGEILRVVP
jgi:RHS repeat-associated protein